MQQIHAAASLTQPTASSSSSEASTSPPQETANYAAERARLLFGQYRKGDANDPATYVASVAAVLAQYPPETIRYVTDPRTGMASNPRPDPETGRRWTGMPDLAQVRAACEDHYGGTRREMERARNVRAQIAARPLEQIPDHTPPKNTIGYAEFTERFGERARPIGFFERSEG